MNAPPTLGSLFDGIGGFPQMLHVGDITKLKGAELSPVDIVTGSSPCQDLSIAS